MLLPEGPELNAAPYVRLHPPKNHAPSRLAHLPLRAAGEGECAGTPARTKLKSVPRKRLVSWRAAFPTARKREHARIF